MVKVTENWAATLRAMKVGDIVVVPCACDIFRQHNHFQTKIGDVCRKCRLETNRRG